MKALKILIIGLVLLIVVLVVASFALPNDYEVKRSTTIESNPTHVSAYIVNLNQWPHWSPWKDFDETIEITLGDISSGVGATQSWSGDSSNGRLEITAVEDNKVEYECYFENDSQSCDCVITFTAEGKNTRVDWNMKGQMDKPVIGAYMAMMMDSMVGPMFEHGLTKLKNAVEQKPNAETKTEANADSEKSEKPSDQEAVPAGTRGPIQGQATKKE